MKNFSIKRRDKLADFSPATVVLLYLNQILHKMPFSTTLPLPFRDRYKVIQVGAFVLGLLLIASPRNAKAADEEQNDSSNLFPEKILAGGKNFKVTRDEFDRAFIFIKANKASLGIPVRGRQQDELETQLLDKLITTKLVLARARPSEREEGEQFVQQQWNALQKQLGSKEAVQRHIIASGVSEDYFRQQLYEEGVVRAVIQREVKGNYLVPESEIRQFYQQNQKNFTEPEAVRIRRISLVRISPSGAPLSAKALQEKETLMQELQQRALQGEDFAQLAKAYSEDHATRQKGGEMIIVKGQTKLEFETPVFRLKKGGLSQVITIGEGMHLVKMLDRKPARLRPLQEVETFIRAQLEAKYVNKKMPQYLENLKKAAAVKIFSGADNE